MAIRPLRRNSGQRIFSASSTMPGWLADCSVWFLWLGVVLLVVVIGGGVYVRQQLHASLPMLDGTIAVDGLSGPVTIERDALGVPTITAATRTDAARALGFLHAQDRFFQMDLQRRQPAGEVSALVGARALELDRSSRVHRFRHISREALAMASPAYRALLEAYAARRERGARRARRRRRPNISSFGRHPRRGSRKIRSSRFSRCSARSRADRRSSRRRSARSPTRCRRRCTRSSARAARNGTRRSRADASCVRRSLPRTRARIRPQRHGDTETSGRSDDLVISRSEIGRSLRSPDRQIARSPDSLCVRVSVASLSHGGGSSRARQQQLGGRRHAHGERGRARRQRHAPGDQRPEHLVSRADHRPRHAAAGRDADAERRDAAWSGQHGRRQQRPRRVGLHEHRRRLERPDRRRTGSSPAGPLPHARWAQADRGHRRSDRDDERGRGVSIAADDLGPDRAPRSSRPRSRPALGRARRPPPRQRRDRTRERADRRRSAGCRGWPWHSRSELRCRRYLRPHRLDDRRTDSAARRLRRIAADVVGRWQPPLGRLSLARRVPSRGRPRLGPDLDRQLAGRRRRRARPHRRRRVCGWHPRAAHPRSTDGD